MPEVLTSLVVELAGGCVGGIAAGAVDGTFSLGVTRNAIVGAFAGVVVGVALGKSAISIANNDGSFGVTDSPLIVLGSRALLALAAGAVVVFAAGFVMHEVKRSNNNGASGPDDA